MNSITEIQCGSYMYGTNTKDSDIDIKSIVVPSAKDILLGNINTLYHPAGTDKNGTDFEEMDLTHFLNRIRDGNPGDIEALFAPDSCLIKSSSTWREIVKNRDKLISKNLTGMFSFASRNAHIFSIEPSIFELAIQAIEKNKDLFKNRSAKFEESNINEIVNACRSEHVYLEKIAGSNDQEIPCLIIFGRKIAVNIRLFDAYKVLKIIEKNGTKRNLDKSRYHALRVITEAIELLQTGQIKFPLTNRDQLLEVKLGLYSDQKVNEMVVEKIKVANALKEKTTLPEIMDDDLAQHLIMNAHKHAVIYN